MKLLKLRLQNHSFWRAHYSSSYWCTSKMATLLRLKVVTVNREKQLSRVMTCISNNKVLEDICSLSSDLWGHRASWVHLAGKPIRDISSACYSIPDIQYIIPTRYLKPGERIIVQNVSRRTKSSWNEENSFLFQWLQGWLNLRHCDKIQALPFPVLRSRETITLRWITLQRITASWQRQR